VTREDYHANLMSFSSAFLILGSHLGSIVTMRCAQSCLGKE
jgi:hypothetical protein